MRLFGCVDLLGEAKMLKYLNQGQDTSTIHH